MAFLKKQFGEYTFMALVLILGICIAFGAAWEYQRGQQERMVEEFHAAANDRIGVIEDKIQYNEVVMRSVAAFYRSSDYVRRDEFSEFTAQLLKDYSFLYTLEWIPRVPAAERAAFEARAQWPGFRITEMNANGTLVPAAKRKEYYPIYYAELPGDKKQYMGLDIGSMDSRLKAIRQSERDGQMVVTGRVTMQVSTPSEPGVVFYEPVKLKKRDAAGREYERVEGFIGSVIPLRKMINTAIKPLNYTGVNILIHDLSADREEDRLLVVRSTRLRDIPDAEIIGDYEGPTPLVDRKVLDVGSRKWQITVLPARGYYTMDIQGVTVLILLSGLVFTGLLVFYMFSRFSENERISAEVLERTADLSKAKRETEMILLSTRDGVMGIDDRGKIIFCNPTVSLMLGYSKRELIGQPLHEMIHYRRVDGTPYEPEASPINQVLEYGRSCNVRDEVFWSKLGEPVQIEYSAAPILEDGSIIGAVVVFRDVAERRAMEKKLENMARYDQLTGLPNRGSFIDHVKSALARAERAKKKVGIVYLDLNGFKPINDSLGHAAGDAMLKKFADAMREVVRDSDMPARMGGDEFTILVDGIANDRECMHLVERLRQRLEKPFEIAGHKFTVGASMGIAFYPDHAQDYETLISCADSAMYKAKKDKSLPFVIYAPE